MGAQQCAGVQDLYVVKTTDDSQVRSSGVPPAQGNTHTLCTYSFYFETPHPKLHVNIPQPEPTAISTYEHTIYAPATSKVS